MAEVKEKLIARRVHQSSGGILLGRRKRHEQVWEVLDEIVESLGDTTVSREWQSTQARIGRMFVGTALSYLEQNNRSEALSCLRQASRYPLSFPSRLYHAFLSLNLKHGIPTGRLLSKFRNVRRQEISKLSNLRAS